MSHPFVEGYFSKEAGLEEIKETIQDALGRGVDWAKDNPEIAGTAAGGLGGAGLGALIGGTDNRLRSAAFGGALGAGGGYAAGYAYDRNRELEDTNQKLDRTKTELKDSRESVEDASGLILQQDENISELTSAKKDVQDKLKELSKRFDRTEEFQMNAAKSRMKELEKKLYEFGRKSENLEENKAQAEEAVNKLRELVKNKPEEVPNLVEGTTEATIDLASKPIEGAMNIANAGKDKFNSIVAEFKRKGELKDLRDKLQKALKHGGAYMKPETKENLADRLKSINEELDE